MYINFKKSVNKFTFYVSSAMQKLKQFCVTTVTSAVWKLAVPIKFQNVVTWQQ